MIKAAPSKKLIPSKNPVKRKPPVKPYMPSRKDDLVSTIPVAALPSESRYRPVSSEI